MADPSSPPTPTPVPDAVAYVRDLLGGLGASWFLCGGWATGAWLGRQTRDHWDVDIAVFHHDQHAIFEHLAGWALVGHDPNVADDTTEPWNGRQLDLPAHIHVPERATPLATSTTATHTAFEFEFLLNERSGQDWVINRDPHIAVPLDRATRPSRWGLPAAAPEVVLFYKGGGNFTPAEVAARSSPLRPRNEQDFLALLPILTHTERAWLRDSLAMVRPQHPWLSHSRGSPRTRAATTLGCHCHVRYPPVRTEMGDMMADDELTRERALVQAGWELVDLLGQLDMRQARKLLAWRWKAERARAAASVAPLRTGDKIDDQARQVSESPSVQTRYLRTLDMVEPGDRVFEIGPGRGYVAGHVLRDGGAAAYRGVDISATNLQSTQEIFDLNGLADRGEVGDGDLRELTRVDVEKFGTDLLVCCEVLEHVPEPERAVKILADALPLGTDLLISVPLLGRVEHVWGHISIFSAARIRNMVENAGLVVHAVDVVDNVWVFVLASHDAGPSARAAHAAAKTVEALADTLVDHDVPRSTRFIALDQPEIGPSVANRRLARSRIEPEGKSLVCELTARRKLWSDGGAYGGLRFPVSSPRGLRLELSLDDIEAVTTFHVDAYAGQKRVARWIWDPAARPPTRQRPTFVLRPGVPDSFFRLVKPRSLASVDAFDLYAAIKPGSSIRFQVLRAAVIS